MTTYVTSQRERNMEIFNSTVALYSALKQDTATMRIKQVMYRADEVQALPLDFTIDVETKVKRAVGQRFYDIFFRAVFNENTEILSNTLRETLGNTFWEYGLGPDGTYRRLYYTVKNEQVRSFLKERDNGAIAKFDRSTGLDGPDATCAAY